MTRWETDGGRPPKPDAPEVTSGQLDPKPSQPKFRQESAQARPSDCLRREDEPPSGEAIPSADGDAPDASGQHGPKSKKTAKEARRMDKSKSRVEKSGDKLTAAKEKLAAQKPPKPPGMAKTLTAAAGYEVWAKVHGKIHETEHENVGTEAAHRTELLGEKTGHSTIRHAKHRARTRPARQAAKWERKSVKATADYRFRQMAQENPGLNSNPLNRLLQKRLLKKQYQKQVKEAAKKGAKKAGKKALSATEKVGRAAVNFVKSHPTGVLIALLCFLLIVVLQSCVGGALTVGNGLAGAVGGTSYLAEDADIDEAELRYTEWEADLELQAKNAAATHRGYDEYRYTIAAIGHNPYELLAFLTAKYDDFTYSGVENVLRALFAEQYTLTFTPTVETRYRTEWRTGSYTDADGNSYSYSYTVQVPYDWHILTVTLTSRSFTNIVSARLTTQDECERYAVYMFLHGNRQYVGRPFAFDWLPYVSSYYGYRVHPISGEKDYHTGVDIAIPIGTEILSGGNGMVLQTGNDAGGYGLYLAIDYGKGITARYAHCSALHVSAGQSVSLGEVIALSGNTGNSTGPHLHMEVIKNGRYLNPLYFVDGTQGG
jgi:murein DD-endopeptidase MepM/ murein hydrolase activator NlpD